MEIRLLDLALPSLCASVLALPPTFSAAQASDSMARAVSQESGLPGAAMYRGEVRRMYPGIEDELQKALAPTLYRVGRQGQSEVEFRLEQGRVDVLKIRGGPLAYRMPIRRAMRGVNCVGDSGPDRRHVFLLVFKFRDDEDGDVPSAAEMPVLAISQ